MDENYALTRLYHPKGAQVSIPLSLMTEITTEQGHMLMRSLDNLLTAGWSVTLPGVEPGESMDEIGFVARREKFNTNDSTTTPIVDLYPNKEPNRGGAFKLIHMYLNTADDVAAFEAATGVKLAQIPLFNGDNAIERGKGKDNFVLTLPAPTRLVWKQNPQWEGENDKKHPKRLFVRWFDLRPQVAVNPATGEVLTPDFSNVKTPGGLLISALDKEKLTKLTTANAPNVTDEMREAAKFYLKGK